MAKIVRDISSSRKPAACPCGAEWKTHSYHEVNVAEDVRTVECHVYCPVCDSSAVLVEEWHKVKAFYTVKTKQ